MKRLGIFLLGVFLLVGSMAAQDQAKQDTAKAVTTDSLEQLYMNEDLDAREAILLKKLDAKQLMDLETLRMPKWVFSHTGKNVPHATKNIFEFSDIPSQRIARGTRATGGMARKLFTMLPRLKSRMRRRPVPMPRRTPRLVPIRRPIATRIRLANTSGSIVPSRAQSTNAIRTRHGPGNS